MISLFQIVFTAILIAIALYFMRGSRKTLTASNELLLYGLQGSRKTRLFFKLLANKLVETTTSFAVNREQFEHADGLYTLIDFPGSSSFDAEFKSALKPGSRILFLIDSAKRWAKQQKHLRLRQQALRALRVAGLPGESVLHLHPQSS